MSHIGFDPSAITTSVIILALVTFISEVPAGVLADRWSRKGTLVLSMAFLTVAAIIFSASNTIPIYLVGVVCFAVYAAMYSGLIDSIIYDTAVELDGSGKKFSQYFGRSKFFTSLAWVIGSLLGAFIAQKLGLRAAFLASVPSCVLALSAAAAVREPVIHKTFDEQTKLLNHIKLTFRYISKRENTLWVVLCIVATSVPLVFLMEVDQLWPMALMLPLIWYGPLNAVLLSGPGIGGVLAHKLQSSAQWLLLGFMGIVSVALLSIPQLSSVVIGQFATIAIFTALNIIATGKLHDSVPSRVRTGVASAVSTLSTLFALPLLFIFGVLVNNYSIFVANYLLIVISVVVFMLYVKLAFLAKRAAE